MKQHKKYTYPIFMNYVFINYPGIFTLYGIMGCMLHTYTKNQRTEALLNLWKFSDIKSC